MGVLFVFKGIKKAINNVFRGINKVLGDFAPIAAIAVAFIPGMQGFAGAMLKGFIAGGIASGNLKGAAIGAFSAAIFYGVGQHFSNGGKLAFADAGLPTQAAWAGSHAVAGGVINVLQGGKFGHGFVSAGFTKFAMGSAGFDYQNKEISAVAGRTTVAALVGGTVSELTGGKFGNSARTAAMAHLFNAEGGMQKSLTFLKNNWGNIWGDFKQYFSDSFDREMNLAASAARNSFLSDLPDGQGIKAGGCAGFYLMACAEVTATNQSLIWSRGLGRGFGAEGGMSYVPVNANQTNGSWSWTSGVTLYGQELGSQLSLQPQAQPSLDMSLSVPTLRPGFAFKHVLMKHQVYKGN